MQQVATLFSWYCQCKLFLSSSLLSLMSLLSSYMLLTITNQCCSTQHYEQELNDQSLVIFPARLNIASYFIPTLFPAHPLSSCKDNLHVLYKLYDMVVWYGSFMFLCFSLFCGNIVKLHKNATDIDMFRVKIFEIQELVHTSKSKRETMLLCLCHEFSTTDSFLQCNSPQCILPSSFGTCTSSFIEKVLGFKNIGALCHLELCKLDKKVTVLP